MKKNIIIQCNTIFKAYFWFTKGQLSYLSSRGLAVYAICSPDKEARDFFLKEGVDYCPISIERDIFLIKDIISFFRIVSLINRLKPNVVQGATPKAALLVLIAAWILRVPKRIFFVRGVRHSELSGIKRLTVKFFEQTTCFCASTVICTSYSVMHSLSSGKICPERKLKVLNHGTGNGIDTTRFNPLNYKKIQKDSLLLKLQISKKDKIILFVGRVVYDKGIVDLYDSWQNIKEKYNSVTLLIIGTINDNDPVPEDILNSLKSDDKVRILGHVNDVMPYYSISSIFVLPSYREGIPISVLEASAMELPIVSTKVTGCVDAVIDGVTGTLVNPKRHDELYNAISHYLDNDSFRLKHGKSGREMVIDKFKPEDIWEKLYQEYL